MKKQPNKKPSSNGVKASLPCYKCCEYCANYVTCDTRNACGRCEYNVYGECTHPLNPTLR